MTQVTRLAFTTVGVWCFLLVANEALAVAGNEGVVGIVNLESSDAGTIQASGTYSAKARWRVTAIVLIAAPAGGGVQSSQSANFGKGKWGDASIAGLESGVKYNVYVQMTLADDEGNSQTINGPILQMKPK